MSVRWKPMILISALFVLIAAVGLLAITSTLMQSSPAEILAQARDEAKDGKYERAQIQYRRALQSDPRNPEIHAEFASMLERWAEAAPAVRGRLRPERLNHLVEAARYGKRLPGPRRALLADALRREEFGECLYWARELESLEPDDLDASYVLAIDALNRKPPDSAAAKPRVELLTTREPSRPRTTWLRVRLAEEVGDEATLASLLDEFRGTSPVPDPIDQIARLRLRLIDLKRTDDAARLPARVEALRTELAAFAIDEAAPGRVRQVSQVLERAQAHLAEVAARRTSERVGVEALAQSLEGVADAIYKKAIDVTGQSDLRPSLAYAESLMIRDRRDRCLQVVAEALRRPIASQSTWLPTAMELREVAIKASLSDPSDPGRFEKAAPYIKELLASTTARYKALGHLFQGLIDLERSGLASAPSEVPGEPGARPVDGKLGASALSHLKAAATGLKDVPTAQALYGVALILSREPALGRQYLQDARRLGSDALDPRYQVWAAWSVLQAGYPEEADPIVGRLLERMERGELSSEYAATLHMLKGEVHQARRTPDELRLARAEYQEAIEAGQAATPALRLRLAQLDALLGEPAQALARIDELSRDAGSGPAAEQLAVLTLRNQGQGEQAATRLADARKRYPDSADLAGLDAAMRLDAKQPEEAERLLAEFLAAHPRDLELALLRARVLAGPLERVDEAREILSALAETAETSVPLVQLALLDLSRKDYESVERSIAKIRERWSEAAAADLLDAQLAFARGNPRASAAHLDVALKKDPSNKVALFWKAQLDDLAGSGGEARQIFESILRDRPVKELDAGLPLTAAAQWALASMALDRQDYDGAISRFEALLQDGDASELGRPVRWKLALARAARGDVERAKAEVAELLRSPQTTADERVQAADFYQNHGDPAAADAQLGQVLEADPSHPGAVAYRALMWASRDKGREAATLVRHAIDAGRAPAGLYLLLAAIENREGAEGLSRATAALDEGLRRYPDSGELLRARYELMAASKDPRAIGFVEEFAKAHPEGPARRVLIEVYRENGRFDQAERELRGLLKEVPRGSAPAAQLTAQLVEVVLALGTQAAGRGDEATEQARTREAAALIAQGRERFPQDLNFPRFECELAARAGDFARAKQVAGEMAALDLASPVGPLLAARLALATNQPDEAIRAFEQALERSPSRADIRLELGRTRLALGQHDEAIQQASAVLAEDGDSAAAVLLKARALASRRGAAAAVEAGREEAATILEAAIQASPTFAEAYHLLAEVRLAQGHRDRALAALRSALKAIPTDDVALSLLVQHLSEPRGDAPASEAEIQEARSYAEHFGAGDERGAFCLALAVGYHKAGRADLALPWAEKAAAKLDRPIVHLTRGDILLTLAESNPDPARARDDFRKAVAAYDRVLERQPDSVEAVNNKAWILHRYLDRNAEALELAEGLLRKAGRTALPAEFYDTLGAIQQAVGKPDEAERSFAEGLRRAPDHAILNYHMGRLLSTRPDRADEARRFLEKARDARQALPLTMAKEVDDLLARVVR